MNALADLRAAPVAVDGIAAGIAAHPSWQRLEEQCRYYSMRASQCQAAHKRAQLGSIGLAAAIPMLAFLPGEAARYAVALAGVAIAMLEGLLLVNQYATLWLRYRGTAESLMRERALLLAGAGEYRGLPEPEALRTMAERVEVLLEVEHRGWTEEQKQALAQLSRSAARSSAPREATN